MRTAHLPVRPEPRTREPLSRYVVRLAEANGVSPSRVLPPWRHDIDVPKSELATVAALGRLQPAETARMTMDRYPPAIRGYGPQHRHGWRLHHSVRWICPICTLPTGHTDLLWQTALMPVCLQCDCYLVQRAGPHVMVPATPRILELTDILGELAEASIDDRRARERLYRLRRRCQARAATITATDSEDGLLASIDVTAARKWTAYPCPDPVTAAALLILSGGRLRREKRTKPRHLRRHQSAAFTSSDRDRLEWFLTRIRHHITHDGLRSDHVPALLPHPAGDNERGPGAWLSLTRAATALHMLINTASGRDPSPEVSTHALGVHGIPTCLLIDGVHAGAGLRAQDCDLLTKALDRLLVDGLVDYQRRRDTLRSVTRLPGSTLRRLPSGSPAVGQRSLALAWIWTRFTHGPMRSSPWPTIPDRDVHVFDKRLDPETRLLLHETGQQLLADTDLLHIPATQTTWAGISRRYG